MSASASLEGPRPLSWCGRNEHSRVQLLDETCLSAKRTSASSSGHGPSSQPAAGAPARRRRRSGSRVAQKRSRTRLRASECVGDGAASCRVLAASLRRDGEWASPAWRSARRARRGIAAHSRARAPDACRVRPAYCHVCESEAQPRRPACGSAWLQAHSAEPPHAWLACKRVKEARSRVDAELAQGRTSASATACPTSNGT